MKTKKFYIFLEKNFYMYYFAEYPVSVRQNYCPNIQPNKYPVQPTFIINKMHEKCLKNKANFCKKADLSQHNVLLISTCPRIFIILNTTKHSVYVSPISFRKSSLSSNTSSSTCVSALSRTESILKRLATVSSSHSVPWDVD